MTSGSNSSSLERYDPVIGGNLEQSPGLLTIPPEMVHEILLQLHYESIQTFSLVSKGCHVRVSSFWRFGLMRLFPSVQPAHENDRRNFIVHSNISSDMSRSSFILTHPWFCSALICQDRLVTSDDRAVVQVWDLNTFEGPATLKGVRGGLAVHQDKVVLIGTSARKMEFWDLTKNRCETTLESSSEVTCAISDQEHFVSGHQDGAVVVWDLKTASPACTFHTHSWITTLKIDREKVIGGTYGGQIFVFDIKTEQCTGSITAHQGQINSIVLHQETIYSCSHGDAIKAWDLQTLNSKGTLAETQEANPSRWYQMEMLEGRLFVNVADSSTRTSKMVVWDLATKTHTLLKHMENISFVPPLMHHGKLILGHELGTQICDFTIPESQIRYPQLAHFGIVTIQDFQEKLGCDPKQFLQLWHDPRFDQNFYKPIPKVTLPPLELGLIKATSQELKQILKDRLAELEEFAQEGPAYEKLCSIRGNMETLAYVSLDNYRQLATELNQWAQDYNSMVDHYHAWKLGKLKTQLS